MKKVLGEKKDKKLLNSDKSFCFKSDQLLFHIFRGFLICGFLLFIYQKSNSYLNKFTN